MDRQPSLLTAILTRSVNVENHEGAHMASAVRLGKVFDL